MDASKSQDASQSTSPPSDAQRPPSSSAPSQPDAGAASQPGQQMGEGSYEGSRQYEERTKAYLETADVKADAKAAEPESPEELEQLKKAEQEGLSHSKAPGQ
jgi:hypothetical protein